MEDVTILAHHFLDQLKKEFNRPDIFFGDDALELMQRHNYPGNVRELYNLISSASAIVSGATISASDISLGLSNKMFDLSNGIHGNRKEDTAFTLEEKERLIILQAIEKHSHNLTKVCEELGISRTTLWRRMKDYAIK
jgi:two-component system NtrC family response regulator